MQTFTADFRMKISALLARQGIQAWRIAVLAQAGAIYSPDRTQVVRDVDLHVDRGVHVLVDDTSADYQAAVAHLPPEHFRDYAYAPEASTDGFVGLQGKLLAARPQTVRLNQTSLEGFIKGLAKDPLVTGPVRDLYIASHYAGGFLFLRLATASDSDTITYQDLKVLADQGAGSPLAIPPTAISPRPSGPDGKPAPLTVRVRGCELATTPPMMTALKAALGGQVRIHGAKFLWGVQQLTTPAGYIEFFRYPFEVVRATPFKTREEAIAAFKAKNFTFLDGKTPVPPDRWGTWLPSEAGLAADHGDEKAKAGAPTTPALASSVNVSKVQVTFRYSAEKIFNPPVTFTPLGGKDPGSEKDRIQAAIALLKVRFPDWTDASAFPTWKQFYFDTLEEMTKTLQWHFHWNKQTNQLEFNILYHFYCVEPPVVELGTNKLKFNFFPTLPSKPGAPAKQPIVNIDEDDPQLFTAV